MMAATQIVKNMQTQGSNHNARRDNHPHVELVFEGNKRSNYQFGQTFYPQIGDYQSLSRRHLLRSAKSFAARRFSQFLKKMQDTLQTPRQNVLVGYLWIASVAKLIAGVGFNLEHQFDMWMIGSSGAMISALFLHMLYYLCGCNSHSYNKTRNCDPCISPVMLETFELVIVGFGIYCVAILDFSRLQVSVVVYALVIVGFGVSIAIIAYDYVKSRAQNVTV
jgi:hypothetical protein